jgi:hypothetical protein
LVFGLKRVFEMGCVRINKNSEVVDLVAGAANAPGLIAVSDAEFARLIQIRATEHGLNGQRTGLPRFIWDAPNETAVEKFTLTKGK